MKTPAFRVIPRPSQWLLYQLTGDTQLPLEAYVEVGPGRGDRDACYRVDGARCVFNAAHDASLYDLEDWAVDEATQ